MQQHGAILSEQLEGYAALTRSRLAGGGGPAAALHGFVALPSAIRACPECHVLDRDHTPGTHGERCGVAALLRDLTATLQPMSLMPEVPGVGAAAASAAGALILRLPSIATAPS